MDERRKYQRVNANFSIEVHPSDTSEGETENVSQSGILFTHSSPHEVGMVIELILRVPGLSGKEKFKAKVVRCEKEQDSYKVAANFIDIDEAREKNLQELLNSFSRHLELLILILHRGEYLEDILTGLVDAGITGATVADGYGMMDVLSHNVPVFAGLRFLNNSDGQSLSKIVFSAIKDANTVEKAKKFLKNKAKEIHEPHLGVILTAPLNYFDLLGHSDK